MSLSATHRPALHTLLSHSSSLKHSRQRFEAGSQIGLLVEHCALLLHSRQPFESGSHPSGHSISTKSVPASLHFTAVSARHASSWPATQSTAIHVSGFPSMSPSKSQ